MRNVKFKRRPQSTLQTTLRENMDRMADDNMLYVVADKTNNYCRMSVEDHGELLMKTSIMNIRCFLKILFQK